MEIEVKRVYEPADGSDGYRILVDRLWPRGVSKERAAIDLWSKSTAPSPDLRKAWNHDPATFEQFAASYRAELDQNPQAVDDLCARIHEAEQEGAGRVTLVYGAKDPQINHAQVLKAYLRERLE